LSLSDVIRFWNKNDEIRLKGIASAASCSASFIPISTKSNALGGGVVSNKKVVLFIIDALRLDFMTQYSHTVERGSHFNSMVNMQHLLQYNASQCTLFGLKADPPTVTSQRIKSFTTGTLPTFVDIGANLNSSAVTDDNFIDQLLAARSTRTEKVRRGNGKENKRSKKRSSVVVLGDDTWKSLFPTQFDTQYMFDSFNTKDLDTVDNGIATHLLSLVAGARTDTATGTDTGAGAGTGADADTEERTGDKEAESTDWDLLIAHFLGVDHIGHTHSAFHPLMRQRLHDMDALLLRVIEALPADTLLLLFGDHGMTDAGEHGGATPEETDSGLFVYSKTPIFALKPPPPQEPGVHDRGGVHDVVENSVAPAASVTAAAAPAIQAQEVLSTEELEESCSDRGSDKNRVCRATSTRAAMENEHASLAIGKMLVLF
jgi:predicted AlkP superfamily pyrophosphatase or phosphodiesterase